MPATSPDSVACYITDLTEQEQADSEAIFDDAAHREPKHITIYPPEPRKFTKRRPRSSHCEATPPQQKPEASSSDVSFIQAMRRHTYEQIYDSELCLIVGGPEQEDLWASLDGMFMQL
jgi:hypothetical protein